MKATRTPQLRLPDPYLGNVDLPLSAAYYPAGFPLYLSTNSRDVLESANESWGRWAREFERAPMKIRVQVEPKGALAPSPSYRRQGHVLTVISDTDNFAVADLRSLEGCIFVSARTAADHAWLRWFFLESVAYILLAQRYAVPVHAACLMHDGSGVLLCGPSQAGKSTLSFACARAGWTFVSDDATWLLPDTADSIAIGRPHQARLRADAPAFFPELEEFPERVRPNGKLSLEVPLEEFPEIRTAAKAPVGTLVLLDRGAGTAPKLETIQAVKIVEFLLHDAASYGEDVDRERDKTVRKLLRVPAYRLCYDRLDDGVELLARLKT